MHKKFHCYTDLTIQLLEDRMKDMGVNYWLLGSVFTVQDPPEELIAYAKDLGANVW